MSTLSSDFHAPVESGRSTPLSASADSSVSTSSAHQPGSPFVVCDCPSQVAAPHSPQFWDSSPLTPRQRRGHRPPATRRPVGNTPCLPRSGQRQTRSAFVLRRLGKGSAGEAEGSSPATRLRNASEGRVCHGRRVGQPLDGCVTGCIRQKGDHEDAVSDPCHKSSNSGTFRRDSTGPSAAN